MELDFDKEIDVLLRQTARSGDFVSNQPAAHLDADEIAAFAENALPEKTRQTYMRHLADCERCRKSLSNLIALNSGTENEIVYEEEKQLITPPVAWYRKLFAFPHLAYAMGALILVFSGIAAYTVLQSVNVSQNSEVSQTYDKQPGGKGMSSDGDAMPSESYSSNRASNAASMNSAVSSVLSNSNSAMPSAPMTAANSNIMMNREAEKTLQAESKAPKPLTVPDDSTRTEDSVAAATPMPPPPPAKENSFEIDGADKNQTTLSQKQVENLPKPSSVPGASSGALRRADTKSKKLEALKDDTKSIAETTSVGGKSFKRANNAWVDSAYRGQATTNITRGTKEYKKLDSGLRDIAENLGGTVVVVWKEKAYRIQ